MLILLIAVIAFLTRFKIMALRKISVIVDDLPKGNGEYLKRRISDIDRIMIHHSASPLNHTAYTFAAWHTSQQGKNWPGIGYHYVINPDGSIQQTNYLTTRSYHSGRESNTKGVGVCLVGNFDSGNATPEQVQSLKWLIKYLRYETGKKLAVLGHFEVMNTSCPGVNFRNTYLNEIKAV